LTVKWRNPVNSSSCQASWRGPGMAPHGWGGAAPLAASAAGIPASSVRRVSMNRYGALVALLLGAATAAPGFGRFLDRIGGDDFGFGLHFDFGLVVQPEFEFGIVAHYRRGGGIARTHLFEHLFEQGRLARIHLGWRRLFVAEVMIAVAGAAAHLGRRAVEHG